MNSLIWRIRDHLENHNPAIPYDEREEIAQNLADMVDEWLQDQEKYRDHDYEDLPQNVIYLVREEIYDKEQPPREQNSRFIPFMPLPLFIF